MERYAELSKDRQLNIKCRVSETSVPRVLRFLNEDGTPHPITGKGWEIPVKKSAQSSNNIFKLTEGSGLTVQGDDENELLIEVSAEQASQVPNVYFWKLYSSVEDHTWLNGDWEFYAGKYDGVDETTSITILGDDSQVILIHITGSGGSTDGAWIDCGDLDASGGALPTTGGTGTGGYFKRNNTLQVTTEGTIDGVFLPVGTTIMARQDEPTIDWDTTTGWKYF